MNLSGLPSAGASSMIAPYIGLRFKHVSRGPSYYRPSCLMMDYFIHIMNDALVCNFKFRRYCPSYHPYYIRLYYGVLFWIQCLRAGQHAHSLSTAESEFLNQFLRYFPLHTLTVCGPLLYIFKSLCTSQPELKNYGLVFPLLPHRPGPDRRDAFMNETVESMFLPNVPGIFALIAHLHSFINKDPDNQEFPDRGKHFPIPADAEEPITFGFHTFPAPADMEGMERYFLCSPGLQYPCEADKSLNQAFDENFPAFSIPHMRDSDTLDDYSGFLHMKNMTDTMHWFAYVSSIADDVAKFFSESGTLADCAPHGLPINQYVVHLQRPDVLPTPPQYSADPRSFFPFHVRLSTTLSRSPIPWVEAMAASAQTNIIMFAEHPDLGNFGAYDGRGPFWAIRPIAQSEIDSTSYFSCGSAIRGMMKNTIEPSKKRKMMKDNI